MGLGFGVCGSFSDAGGDVVEMPDSFDVADRAAMAAQHATRRVYAVELGALVVAALAGITAWHVGAGHLDVVAGVGTLAFVVAVVCVFYRDARHPQAD